MRYIALIAMMFAMVLPSTGQTDTTQDQSAGIVYSKPAASVEIDSTDKEINWLTWEQAMMANTLENRKIFVMVYTDWCQWCKKMKASTFRDSMAVEYLNRDFYPVLLNAEGKDTIEYKNYEFKFREQGEKGFHELAASLLNGKMNYPSFVILDEREVRLKVIQGYQNVTSMRNSLIFYAHDGHLKNEGAQFGLGYQCTDPSHRHTQPNYLGAPKK